MRILIIEDEEKLATAVKLGLERQGYAADVVLDGEAGQKRIEINYKNYDLVILDLMLPKKSGLVICQEVRKLKIPIPSWSSPDEARQTTKWKSWMPAQTIISLSRFRLTSSWLGYARFCAVRKSRFQ